MDLETVLSVLDGEILSRPRNLDRAFVVGAAADLMSDVLAFAPAGSLLLTGLTNPQVIRTAEMAGIGAIVFVRGKQPPTETVRLAREVGITLVVTRYTLYETCGRLYAAGLGGLGHVESYHQAEQAPA
ncbi:MAG: DRTGG domain-containing protein [Anaerolineae bacterium]